MDALRRMAFAEALPWMFEALDPPLAMVREGLASADPGTALAAAQALARRAHAGCDRPTALAAAVPADVLALAPEVQQVLADLALEGLPLSLPPLPAGLPPELARRFRGAALLAMPELLPLDDATALDLRAVAGAPVERALASGLWRRAAAHARPAMHDVAIALALAGLKAALLDPAEAQEVLVDLAHRSSAAPTARALSLLAEPWAHALPCPPLHAWMEADEEVALAALRLAAARGELVWVRHSAASDVVPRSIRRAALSILGVLGAAEDVAALVAAAEEDPPGLGPEAIHALQALKRRGISPDEEQGRRILALVLAWEALPVEAAAESVSSRADALVTAIAAQLESGASKARAVRFLSAFGTRQAVARLVELAASAADPVLSRLAIRALGVLEERDAEPAILARLEAEPEACLFALARIGSRVAVDRLRAALAEGKPLWLAAGLGVLLRLSPSPDVLAAAVEHGSITSDALEALPAYAGAEQVHALAGIAEAPGHPFRAAAIGALGRTGGPLAVDPLATLLTDADDAVRDLAKAALRTLGHRLASPDPPLACLAAASDPGSALLAEAALRRLRTRPAGAAEVVLLLDALAGCAHPGLVRVVRPYLRRSNVEIRKRAAAALAAAGPACASWLLPHLADAQLPVARQALLAIGAAAVPGLGATLAAWLSHPNMNLKKAAAEALATGRDPAVIPPLVAGLAQHDQPGLRALLEAALVAHAGPFHRSVLASALATEADPRRRDLLASTLAGGSSAAPIAALAVSRPEIRVALLLAAYGGGGHEALTSELDAGLARRGAAAHIPHESDVPPNSLLRRGLARADAARHMAALRQRLRAAPFLPDPAADLDTALGAAAEGAGTSISVREQRVLAWLIPRLAPSARADAIALLARASDATVLARLLPHVDIDGEIDPRHAPLLAAVVARRGAAAAYNLARHPRAEVRGAAAEVLALTGEGSLADTPPAHRAAALGAWIDAGRDDAILAAMEGPGAFPVAVVAAAVAARAGAATAMALASRWATRAPVERAPAMVELAFLGAIVEPALRALVQGDARGEIRRHALEVLIARRAAAPDVLRPRLDDVHSAIREEAALALVRGGDRDDRRRIVDAWIAGAVRGAFAFPLEEQDAAAVERAALGAEAEADQLHLLGPAAALPPGCGVPLLLALRASPHARVRAAARDALRVLPHAVVLPRIEAQIRAGDLSVLDVLGVAGAVPRPLADLARVSADAGAWTRFCLRAAGTGLLYAAGLSDSIAAWAAADPSSLALSLLARLTDWYDAAHAGALIRPLLPALAGPRRAQVLATILEALCAQPPALVARVLVGIVRPTDAAAVRRLAEVEASSPGLLERLEPTLRVAVEHALATALDTADPEAARSLLSYFAARAARPSERDAVLVLLERYVGAPARRVRLHAHRLLRTLAPRERYLRATRALLDDPDPTTVRLAVRVLAFGGDAGSAGEIADLLTHPHGAVLRAAREGLLVLGQRAVAPLLAARGRARPDRRAAIDAVLDAIRAREGAG